MPTTRILMFASLVDLMGTDELELSFDRSLKVSELVETLEKRHPELKKFQRRFRVAVNHDFVEDHFEIAPGDEVALIPPVSGGAGATIRAAITAEPIDVAALTNEVRRTDCGAVVSFLGTVRDLTGEQVTEKLEYSAYREMAQKKLEQICRDAAERFSLGAAVAEHRVGELQPGEIAVMVACSSPHRREAFEAGRYLIDTIKAEVPLWKKEFGPHGKSWVEGPVAPEARL
ncbi:MAG: molybdopterin converting factor subunit 1 [Vulcanimicrobiota bacterium]